jgi:hypothetical protein
MLIMKHIHCKTTIRRFTTNQSPNPKPPDNRLDTFIVGILISLGFGQWLRFYDYSNKRR